jgi:predicted nuclease with TOPRIM domain
MMAKEKSLPKGETIKIEFENGLEPTGAKPGELKKQVAKLEYEVACFRGELALRENELAWVREELARRENENCSLQTSLKQSIAEMLAHQQREYDELSKNCAETTAKKMLAQEAWKAARQAARETDPEYLKRSQRHSWRNMWIVLAIAGVILLVLNLLSYR